MRRCTGCKQTKAESDFGVRSQAKDGKNCRCKVCANNEQKARYIRDREKISARNKEIRNRAKDAARAKLYYWANREVIRTKRQEYLKRNHLRIVAKISAWQKANPDRVRAYKAAYRKLHQEEARQHVRIRRARKTKAFVEVVTAEALARRDGSHCNWCGDKNSPLAIDHVLAISRGGKHAMNNCVLSCKSCNSRKGTKLPLVFLMERR